MSGRPQQRSPRRTPNRRLTELRLNEGLSPGALAWRAGIAPETVRMAEAGFTPTARVQFALSAVFKLTPLDLWPLDRQRVYQ